MRQVDVPAQTKGTVATLQVKTGALVEEGQLLARIDMGDRTARLREAQALLEQRQTEYQAATQPRKSSVGNGTDPLSGTARFCQGKPGKHSLGYPQNPSEGSLCRGGRAAFCSVG